jgi:hypothetical protein
LSAAVKNIVVRFVSTRTTSSESTNTSSFLPGDGFAGGVGWGDWLVVRDRFLSWEFSRSVLLRANRRSDSDPTQTSAAINANTKALFLVVFCKFTSRKPSRSNCVVDSFIPKLRSYFHIALPINQFDFNSSEAAIVAIVPWLIGYQVLSTQLFIYLCKRTFQ